MYSLNDLVESCDDVLLILNEIIFEYEEKGVINPERNTELDTCYDIISKIKKGLKYNIHCLNELLNSIDNGDDCSGGVAEWLKE